jgi:hypothetical protein
MPETLLHEIETPVVDRAQMPQTLDPLDWEDFRRQAHEMLDDILDYTRNIRERPSLWGHRL